MENSVIILVQINAKQYTQTYKNQHLRLQNNKLKKNTKFIALKFGSLLEMLLFCTRRDGRVVECGGLENR